MNNIINFVRKEHATHNMFELHGSCVDFLMEEIEIPYFPDKKGIVKVMDDYVGLGIVGRDYKLTNHVDFFGMQQDMLLSKLPHGHLDNVQTTYKVARDGAFALMNMKFPNVEIPIKTRRHETTINMRYISWHGVDGLTSNNGVFGAIDSFCTNGMISGEYDKIRRKNTKNFDLRSFVDEVETSVDIFYKRAMQYQAWANREILTHQAEGVLKSLNLSKSKTANLLEQYIREQEVRGSNVWALYSAMTNYSSHTKAMPLRNTGVDDAAQTMLDREFEVTRWVNSEKFQRLAA